MISCMNIISYEYYIIIYVYERDPNVTHEQIPVYNTHICKGSQRHPRADPFMFYIQIYTSICVCVILPTSHIYTSICVCENLPT